MFDLEQINLKTIRDPKGLCEESEDTYNKRVEKAACRIADNISKSPIVLLSGPSGSGKTTSSIKISEALEKKGIKTHYVAMDDYFKDVTPETTPRTDNGEYDLESPLCLDMELLNRHFSELSKGECVSIPKYDFSSQKRSKEPSKELKLLKGEMVVFEGIHALNDMITNVHPEAFKLYISSRSNIEYRDNVMFKSTWFRLVRRTVRDFNFRNATAEKTMSMWASVRRGEKLYISPFKDKADFQFDTSMECELPVMSSTAMKLFATIPEGIDRYDELLQVYPALLLFGSISDEFVANDSLLREFIGGGIYDY